MVHIERSKLNSRSAQVSIIVASRLISDVRDHEGRNKYNSFTILIFQTFMLL